MTGSSCASTKTTDYSADRQRDQVFTLSRPLRPGETIDYFMSHSWHDDADGKWDTLVRPADQFNARHGRDPTFCLDKVCIDQDDIGDGLRALPVT